MPPVVVDRPLLSVRNVAEKLSLSERTVRRLVDEHGLPVLRVGGSLRVDPAELEEWLNSRARAER
jgi:excisionase family DNA binding protein